MLTKKLNQRDYWIYPSPLRPGDWRCVKRNLARFTCHSKARPNKFAWRLRALLFDYSEPYFQDKGSDYFCECDFVCRQPGHPDCSYEADYD